MRPNRISALCFDFARYCSFLSGDLAFLVIESFGTVSISSLQSDGEDGELLLEFDDDDALKKSEGFLIGGSAHHR